MTIEYVRKTAEQIYQAKEKRLNEAEELLLALRGSFEFIDEVYDSALASDSIKRIDQYFKIDRRLIDIK